jgi:hypothetical protein
MRNIIEAPFGVISVAKGYALRYLFPTQTSIEALLLLSLRKLFMPPRPIRCCIHLLLPLSMWCTCFSIAPKICAYLSIAFEKKFPAKCAVMDGLILLLRLRNSRFCRSLLTVSSPDQGCSLSKLYSRDSCSCQLQSRRFVQSARSLSCRDHSLRNIHTYRYTYKYIELIFQKWLTNLDVDT